MSTTTTSMVETQRFGLSGINFNEIVVRIRSLVPSSTLLHSLDTASKVYFCFKKFKSKPLISEGKMKEILKDLE